MHDTTQIYHPKNSRDEEERSQCYDIIGFDMTKQRGNSSIRKSMKSRETFSSQFEIQDPIDFRKKKFSEQIPNQSAIISNRKYQPISNLPPIRHSGNYQVPSR